MPILCAQHFVGIKSVEPGVSEDGSMLPTGILMLPARERGSSDFAVMRVAFFSRNIAAPIQPPPTRTWRPPAEMRQWIFFPPGPPMRYVLAFSLTSSHSGY